MPLYQYVVTPNSGFALVERNLSNLIRVSRLLLYWKTTQSQIYQLSNKVVIQVSLVVSHISFFVHNASHGANMTPSHPTLYASFHYFRQNRWFSKKYCKFPWQQERQIASLKNSLTYILLLVFCFFFSLPLWIPGEKRAKLKKLFFLHKRLKREAQ